MKNFEGAKNLCPIKITYKLRILPSTDKIVKSVGFMNKEDQSIAMASMVILYKKGYLKFGDKNIFQSAM